MDSQSLTHNEYNKTHSKKLKQGKGRLIFSNSLSGIKNQVKNVLEQKGVTPAVKITETKESGTTKKTCFAKSYRSSNGTKVISIVNIGNTSSRIRINESNNTMRIINLINNKELQNSFEMKPEDVLLLSIEKKSTEKQLIANGTYRINPNMFKDSKALVSRPIENHQVVFLDIGEYDDQKWEFFHLGNNEYRIQNKSTKRFLEVPFSTCKNNTRVSAWTSVDQDHHRWKITKQRGIYFLRPLHCLTQALDIFNTDKSAQNVYTYLYDEDNNNQQWHIVKVDTRNNKKQLITNGVYRIKPNKFKDSKALVSRPVENHQTVFLNIGNYDDQKWEFFHLGNNEYRIQNKSTKRFLEVPFAACENDTRVSTWTSADQDHHRWKITKQRGIYFLRPLHCLTQALDIFNRDQSKQNVSIYQYNEGNNNQQWHIEKVDSNREKDNFLQLVISPNPVEDILNIQLATNTKNAVLTIYSLIGKKLLSKKIDSSSYSVLIDDFVSGAYIAEITSDSRKVSEVFIKK